jgi:hypothetical protein
MAVTRKPRVVPESEIEALIAKGGSVATPELALPAAPPAPGVKLVPVRIDTTLLARIDQAVQAQPIKIPRNTWVLQAILEKLDRDGY